MTYQTPLWTAAEAHSADVLRSHVAGSLFEGVMSDADLLVAPRQAGANMSVDVAAGRVVVGEKICWSDATVNLTVTAPPGGGLSRIDSVQAQVSGSAWSIVVVAGTSSASPSPPALAANSVELARVAVSSSTASITSSELTDVRPYANRVTAADRLPDVAENGQIVVRPDGQIVAYQDDDWQPSPAPSQFGGGIAALSLTALTQTPTNHATVTVADVPTGPVRVFASFTGQWTTNSGSSSALGNAQVKISLDGGSSYTAGSTVLTMSPTSFHPMAISAQFYRTGTPTGQVKAVLSAWRDGSPGGSMLGDLTLTMLPA